MGRTSFTTMQSLWKSELRAPAVDAKMMLVCLYFCHAPTPAGTLFVCGGHSSNKYCVMLDLDIIVRCRVLCVDACE